MIVRGLFSFDAFTHLVNGRESRQNSHGTVKRKASTAKFLPRLNGCLSTTSHNPTRETRLLGVPVPFLATDWLSRPAHTGRVMQCVT